MSSPEGRQEPRDERSRPVADVLDDVRWDFDPEAEDPSPLVSTERYFREFPWEGEADGASQPDASTG